jgi:hypothetical protein
VATLVMVIVGCGGSKHAAVHESSKVPVSKSACWRVRRCREFVIDLAAARDAGKTVGKRYFAGLVVNNASHRVAVYLKGAPHSVIAHLQGLHPGIYVVHDRARQPSGPQASESYSQWGISFRYPARWARLDCGEAPPFGPQSVLTNARPTPTCARHSLVRLPKNGVVVFLASSALRPGGRMRWNDRVDGQAANVPPNAYGAKYLSAEVTCPAGARREYRADTIRHPHTLNSVYTIQALICGPHFATGDAAARHLLASIRFTN